MAIRIHFDDGEVFEEKCPAVDAKTKGDFLHLCEEGTDKPMFIINNARVLFIEFVSEKSDTSRGDISSAVTSDLNNLEKALNSAPQADFCGSVVKRFFDDCCVLIKPGDPRPYYTSRQSVYDAFKAYCEKQCIVADMTLQSFGAEIAKICGVTREENEVAKRDCMGRLVGIYRYCKLKRNPEVIENA